MIFLNWVFRMPCPRSQTSKQTEKQSLCNKTLLHKYCSVRRWPLSEAGDGGSETLEIGRRPLVPNNDLCNSRSRGLVENQLHIRQHCAVHIPIPLFSLYCIYPILCDICLFYNIITNFFFNYKLYSKSQDGKCSLKTKCHES